ncbi:hypothetical protein HRbin16_02635 [bacterium HR16]|nr:hypothetical protein HRbin16_02635 [bacterium HR16]
MRTEVRHYERGVVEGEAPAERCERSPTLPPPFTGEELLPPRVRGGLGWGRLTRRFALQFGEDIPPLEGEAPAEPVVTRSNHHFTDPRPLG